MLLLGKKGLYALLEEVISLLVLLHLRLPFRALELITHLY